MQLAVCVKLQQYKFQTTVLLDVDAQWGGLRSLKLGLIQGA